METKKQTDRKDGQRVVLNLSTEQAQEIELIPGVTLEVKG